MYVKLIDGKAHIAYMPDEEAIGKGYKLAVFSDKPITEAGYHAKSNWTEEESSCSQHWNIEADEEQDASTEELINILLGGDAE